MRGFFLKKVRKALKPKVSREDFAYKVLPIFLLDIITRYLRVTVEGLENIPAKGPAIIIANHSGFMGFDALMLGHQIIQKRKRLPRIITHKLWFIVPEISVVAHKMGLVPATYDNGLKILQNKHTILLFPEGEEGNFKPSKYRYRLRRFRRGFARLAVKTGAPIIPVVVIGAEETNITLSQVKWAKELFGILIPVPLNVLPLPAKWHIKVLKPIRLKKDVERADDIAEMTKISRQVRLQLQRALHNQLKKRKRVFL